MRDTILIQVGGVNRNGEKGEKREEKEGREGDKWESNTLEVNLNVSK
jgi:hypothetical protein